MTEKKPSLFPPPERIKSLEGVKVEKNEINLEEFRWVKAVFHSCKAYAQKIDEVEVSSQEQKLLKNQQALDTIIQELDRFNWAAKFSTSWRDDVRDLSEDAGDSLYFMTSSGITFRLKRIHLEDSLSRVIQTPQEKCFFYRILGGRSPYATRPAIWWAVQEFSSQEFNDAMRWDKNSPESSLELTKNSDGECVRVQSAAVRHRGHGVNHIYFSKP